MKGTDPLTIAQGSTYVDAGSSVTDNVDTGLTSTLTGTVNTAKVGTYTLTYNAMDKAGNAATVVTRTINVPAVLSIANAKVLEGSTFGTTNLNFTVTLNAVSPKPVTVTYTTGDGTALSASDYTASTATLTIPVNATTGMITVLVGADTLFERNETFTLTLSNPTNATIATGKDIAIGTIFNDDVGGMNDTGITAWGNATVNNLTATQALFPNQDADRGRDSVAGLAKTGGGKAGFDFTKLDAAGVVLTNQAATYAVTPWDCVKDNVTGLMWEVKTTTVASLRNKNNTYTWYNSTGINDAGNPGTPATRPACATGGACDTEKYVAAVNAAGLCGFNDWRLPKKGALRSIVDYSITSPSLTIDMAYFPNTVGNWYLSSSRYPTPADLVWLVHFNFGNSNLSVSRINYSVRLVRGGQ